MEEVKLRKIDESKFWDDLDEMFMTDGWRGLVEELRAEVYQTQADALEANTWERVNQLKGRAQAYAYLANLQDIVKMQRQQAAASADVEAD